MLSVERWKRSLQRIGFDGSVSAWPDSFGDDLSIEAIPEDRQLKCVQSIFKVGVNDNRTASELLREFGACLRDVYRESKKQVVNIESVVDR